VTGQLFPSPVPPGSGWPGDVARPSTPVADAADEVRRLAVDATEPRALAADISVCRACPRLVRWRETVATTKRKAFAGQPYWGRPVPGWGSDTAAVLIVGLAPAAHGGNRTGRIFTGDRSGDWLFAALHRVGMAVQATSEAAGDGQRLIDARVVACVRCAPPGNAPTTAERETCAGWLDAELRLALPSARAAVCLGGYAWDNLARALMRLGVDVPRPRPRFTHGARYVAGKLQVIGCYHPSQQNTFTGKLTPSMLDDVLGSARQLAGVGQ
jgi:uracil-DNA glycosylase